MEYGAKNQEVDCWLIENSRESPLGIEKIPVELGKIMGEAQTEANTGQ